MLSSYLLVTSIIGGVVEFQDLSLRRDEMEHIYAYAYAN